MPSGDDCSSFNYGNTYWYGAKIYVGNSTVAQGNEFCGYAGSDLKHAANTDLYDQNGDLYDFDFLEAMKVGGSVACPTDIGPSQYVVIEMTEEGC